MVKQTVSRRATGSSKRNYVKGFILVVICLVIALASGAAGFVYVRSISMNQDLTAFNKMLDEYVAVSEEAANYSQTAPRVPIIAERLLNRDRVSDVAIFSLNDKLIWSSSNNALASFQQVQLSGFLNTQSTQTLVFDNVSQFLQSPSFEGFLTIFKSSNSDFVTVSRLTTKNSLQAVVVKSSRDYAQVITVSQVAAIVGFLIVLISNFLVLMVSSRLFRQKTKVVKSDENQFSKKIAQLSDSLDKKEQLQRIMKSASSRAVELNERFLRRVGSDLHDGPAQSIGYAVLRLNQIKSKQNSEELGYEFDAVKEALNESLEEIRGISSGLVLPELEHMSLEEAIHKVIQRHEMNASTQVKETYLNLPDEIPLPIKICAYRFAQEGLNNAYKHGNAEKCRFTAQVTKGVLHLSLKDNGIGFRKSVLNTDGGHLGLAGMKDRIESLGGKLNINSELGVGTAIKVSVPIIGYD